MVCDVVGLLPIRLGSDNIGLFPQVDLNGDIEDLGKCHNLHVVTVRALLTHTRQIELKRPIDLVC